MKARLASSLTSFRLSPTRLDYANITWFSFTTAAVHLTLQAADAFTVCGNAAGLPLALDHSETPQVEVAGSGTAMAPVVMLVAQRTSPVAPQMGLHDYISLAVLLARFGKNSSFEAVCFPSWRSRWVCRPRSFSPQSSPASFTARPRF